MEHGGSSVLSGRLEMYYWPLVATSQFSLTYKEIKGMVSQNATVIFEGAFYLG
jgi:hypothetical protein